MEEASLPNNEKERLKNLESYEILDTVPEHEYDSLLRIAGMITGMPIVLMSLIDSKRQFFKSKIGLEISETPKEYSFCSHALNTPNEMFIVTDSRMDLRFHDNPLVTGEPHVIFYAGMPLVSSEGYPLGTLCVIDNKPNELDQDKKDALVALASQVVRLLDLRKKNKLLTEAQVAIAFHAQQMEEFAYIASHDFKQPLRMINSFMNLLEKNYGHQLDSKALKYIRFAQEGSFKINKLVDELLNYANIGIGSELKGKVNMNELVKEIIELNDPTLIGEKGVITFTELPIIDSFIVPLKIVVRNLISNSIKYSNKQRQLKILLRSNEMESHWQFEVQDNGIGIPKSELISVFDTFKRLGNGDEIEGSGFGLAICKRIVNKLGGEIWVDSLEGSGSSFYFTIPKK